MQIPVPVPSHCPRADIDRAPEFTISPTTLASLVKQSYLKQSRHTSRSVDGETMTATGSPRLPALNPSIAEIMRVSGAAGASIGVLDGKTGEIHLAGLGYRVVDEHLTPDEHTIYHLASLSKSFTASAIGILVAGGKLSFSDRMFHNLPDYHYENETG